jgi:hypothetical protein
VTPLQLQALDFIRDRITEAGYSPTGKEIADELKIGPGRVSDVLSALERYGKIRRQRGQTRNLQLVGEVDLKTVGTGALRAELARRGLTLGSLIDKPLPPAQGAPCAYEHCGEQVGRGKLFCRVHWFAIPFPVRQRILRAFSAKDVEAYSEAIGRARGAIDRASSQIRAAEAVAQ